MKKAIAIVLAILMVAAVVNAFAHPRVPEQSLNNVSENAACGLHRAWAHVQCANGVAAHVFENRLCCHCVPD